MCSPSVIIGICHCNHDFALSFNSAKAPERSAHVTCSPEEIRTSLSLREFEGLSYQEIGKILDCPVGTVRSRIFRGREQIQEAIDHLLPSSIHAGNERRKKE